jgi:hypothetical protein
MGSVRQEAADELGLCLHHVAVPALALEKRELGPFSPYCLFDLVRELGELGLRLAALLEVKIRPVVDGRNHDLLTAPAGEEDEGDLGTPRTDRFQERDAVHPRHLIIGDDGIIGKYSGRFKGFFCRS